LNDKPSGSPSGSSLEDMDLDPYRASKASVAAEVGDFAGAELLIP
jgi:hypothetical protein